MYIILIRAEFYLSEVHSLKEKRAVMQRMRDRVRQDFNVSTAEIDHQDLWQSAAMAFVSIGMLRDRLEKTERQLHELICQNPDVQVTAWEIDWV